MVLVAASTVTAAIIPSKALFHDELGEQQITETPNGDQVTYVAGADTNCNETAGLQHQFQQILVFLEIALQVGTH